MELSEQVLSLELAKKLKELGVKQESLFSYGKEYKDVDNFELDFYKYTKKEIEYYSAFTVSELLELLPLINGQAVQLLKGSSLAEGIYYCCRYDILVNDNSIFCDKNSANSCAKMLIYLLENKLLEI